MWDKEYDREEYVYGKLPNDFLKSHYQAIPKGKVLMLAEGEGRNAVFLAKLGYSVTAVDLSCVGLKKAEKLASENNVKIETICADLAEFDLGDKKWDGIVSIYCHLPPTIRQALYKKIEQAIKPSGVFFLEGYRPEQLDNKTGGPPVASMMASKETLVNELPKFAFSHLEDVDRVVNEGINHNGLGAVIQAIGSLK
ncbi:SAM-dependent methyltransferase [Psychromonas sp. psych-6C06]|uniref:class I SAM-dependent methyltransferase n=1 Tax=Psychromonas sp. psych-6C06 TaxID=2058089 RepID=UPI000C31D96B|nr:class I SAM-dependent methyltransferase [Psychromonas sp. psych-6C06]PKF62473.1 SAM-dependent methyltransferase [Psychromonas sp. psych-6C06]